MADQMKTAPGDEPGAAKRGATQRGRARFYRTKKGRLARYFPPADDTRQAPSDLSHPLIIKTVYGESVYAQMCEAQARGEGPQLLIDELGHKRVRTADFRAWLRAQREGAE